MSVELDPVELGFKRKLRMQHWGHKDTNLARTLPARGLADTTAQEPALRPSGLQGERPERCALCASRYVFIWRRQLTFLGQNHGSQAVRARAIPNPPPR